MNYDNSKLFSRIGYSSYFMTFDKSYYMYYSMRKTGYHRMRDFASFQR